MVDLPAPLRPKRPYTHPLGNLEIEGVHRHEAVEVFGQMMSRNDRFHGSASFALGKDFGLWESELPTAFGQQVKDLHIGETEVDGLDQEMINPLDQPPLAGPHGVVSRLGSATKTPSPGRVNRVPSRSKLV